jgi:hypothetical protein
MSDSSHIFVDSASTKLGSYLTLEQTISQLNLGSIPGRVHDLCPEKKREAMHDFVLKHRFTLIHLVENKERDQNSTAWIKIEPRDFVCYSRHLIRG